ncbi:MAG: DUF3237 family protein [Erysipelotrichaceae bacterium]|nr:DUF3237 family protein [Erysipelotrichaceae bacterium]
MKKSYNVLLMNDSFPPTIDGVANVACNYAKILTGHNHTVTVATPYYPDAIDDYPFEVLRYGSLDTTQQVGYRTGNPFDPAITDALISRKPDFIHVHCPIVSLYYARMLREQLHIPIILTYHTKYDIDFEKALSLTVLQNAAKSLLIDNIKTCDAVWAVSEGAKENLRQLGYDGPVDVVCNGVDFEKGRATNEQIVQLKQKLHINEEFVFLFVGRMMWYKGTRLILDALKETTMTDYKMIFVGDGLDRKEMEEVTKEYNLQDHVIFTGAIKDREELKIYYSLANVFVFPSTFDTNGLVVSEAAACSLGSILIKDSCAAERVTDKQNGYLCEENADSLRQMMEYTRNHPEEVQQIGQHASDEIYMNWEDAVSVAEEKYARILEQFQQESTYKESVLDSGTMRTLLDLQKAVYTVQKTRDDIRQQGSIFLEMIQTGIDTAKEKRERISTIVKDSVKEMEEVLRQTNPVPESLVFEFSILLDRSETTKVVSGNASVNFIPFTGGVTSRLFTGTIRPGAADVQITNAAGIRHMCARYVFEGTDYTGKPCHIFVDNNGYFTENPIPKPFRTCPVFITDSEALQDYLHRPHFRAEGHPYEGGVIIKVFDTDKE